jgi:catechol 2,3-dioxygenase-like lactoylglutathione lyase family enzyme
MADPTCNNHISEIHTVAIPVADHDRALRFYLGTLGFETRMDTSYGGARWVEVAPPGASTSLALVPAGTGPATGSDTGVRLSTDDAAAAHAALRDAGVDVDGEIIPYPVPMFVFRDPDGNRLIVVERPRG